MALEDSGVAKPKEWRSPVPPLTVGQLYRHADFSAISFATTEPLDGLTGQQRAEEALQFGTQIRATGFNPCIIGAALVVRGGTHVEWSPPFDHFVNSYLPALRLAGFRVDA